MAEILGDDMDSDATPVETFDGLLSDTESEWNAFLSSQVAQTPITESKKSIKKTKKRRRKKRKKVLPERKEYVDTISDLDVLLGVCPQPERIIVACAALVHAGVHLLGRGLFLPVLGLGGVRGPRGWMLEVWGGSGRRLVANGSRFA